MKIQHARKSGKTLAAGIVLFCLTALLSGCGKKAKEITADPASLAASISESAVTSDTLTLTAETMIPTIY